MTESHTEQDRPSEARREVRLESWKEIAAYLNRDVSTVRRWEKCEGLPVHRHLHDKLGTVYAYRSELDGWLEGRGSVKADSRQRIRGFRWQVAGLLALAAFAAGLALLVYRNAEGVSDWLLGKPTPGPIDSLAVLPLENLSGDPEQEYFADGMTEALITNLSKIEALKVISRTSSMCYKGVDKLIPEIAAELNVEWIVEGSVLRVGDRVRISVQLIQAATDQNLWAESYEREMRDILALQGDVAHAVAREIQITVTPEEEARLASSRPINPEVYEACLRAQFHLHYFRLEEAKEYIQEAIKKDPTDALAYALLGAYYGTLPFSTASAPRDVFPKARAATTKALELDATSPRAHLNLANILKSYDWDWSGAEQQYRRAIELNPGYMEAHRLYGQFLWAMGRHEQALVEAKRAQDLDPLSPSSNTWVGVTLIAAQRYEEAIELLQETSEMYPDFAPAHWHIVRAYMSRGMYEEAIASSQKTITLLGEGDSTSKAMLATVYALSGRRDEATEILDELQELEKRSYVPPMFIAYLYSGLGDKEQALRWLEKAYEVRDGYMFAYRNQLLEGLFVDFRDDPRFRDLLRRMNFPE